MKSPRRGNTHQPPEVRRQALLEAALICFARNGYVGTTVDDIASEAKLSKGSVYRFFKSKEEIILTVIDEMTSNIFKIRQEAIATAQSPLEQIHAISEATFIYSDQHSDMNRVWDEFAYHPMLRIKYDIAIKRMHCEMRTIIKQGIESGDFIEQPLDPITDAILALQYGTLEMSRNSEEFSLMEKFYTLWPIMERMLIKA